MCVWGGVKKKERVGEEKMDSTVVNSSDDVSMYHLPPIWKASKRSLVVISRLCWTCGVCVCVGVCVSE